jgi:hypothetical protein
LLKPGDEDEGSLLRGRVNRNTAKVDNFRAGKIERSAEALWEQPLPTFFPPVQKPTQNAVQVIEWIKEMGVAIEKVIRKLLSRRCIQCELLKIWRNPLCVE